MPAPKSDPQRDEVYWLEAEFNGWWEHCRSTREQLEAFAASVCNYYKVDRPRIVISNATTDCNGDYLLGCITLYRSSKGDNCGVLLHELAHHIIDEVYEEAEHHGPEFMAIYMHLLDKYLFLPNEEFRRLAKKYKCRIGRRYRPVAFK